MINFVEIFGAFLVLFAIIDITGSIPIFLSLRQQGNKISAFQAAGVSLGLFLAFFFVGDGVLKLFGVDINSFAVAGAIVIFVTALEMILGIEIFKNDNNGSGSSVIPIAFPLIAGPGALTTIISLRAEYSDFNILIALALNIIIDFVVLHHLDKVEKILGQSLITILRKFFGVILLAIAVKLFVTNLGVIIAAIQ